MAGKIHQLSFVATRRSGEQGAPAPAPKAERINQLHMSARGFEALRLTGLLLHHGPRLLYYIEGAEADVMAQFNKIKSDPRVQGVATLRQRDSDERLFDRWAFALDDDPRDAGGRTVVDRLIPLLHRAPPDIRQTFLAFARL